MEEFDIYIQNINISNLSERTVMTTTKVAGPTFGALSDSE